MVLADLTGLAVGFARGPGELQRLQRLDLGWPVAEPAVAEIAVVAGFAAVAVVVVVAAAAAAAAVVVVVAVVAVVGPAAVVDEPAAGLASEPAACFASAVNSSALSGLGLRHELLHSAAFAWLEAVVAINESMSENAHACFSTSWEGLPDVVVVAAGADAAVAAVAVLLAPC